MDEHACTRCVDPLPNGWRISLSLWPPVSIGATCLHTVVSMRRDDPNPFRNATFCALHRACTDAVYELEQRRQSSRDEKEAFAKQLRFLLLVLALRFSTHATIPDSPEMPLARNPHEPFAAAFLAGISAPRLSTSAPYDDSRCGVLRTLCWGRKHTIGSILGGFSGASGAAIPVQRMRAHWWRPRRNSNPASRKDGLWRGTSGVGGCTGTEMLTVVGKRRKSRRENPRPEK